MKNLNLFFLISMVASTQAEFKQYDLIPFFDGPWEDAVHNVRKLPGGGFLAVGVTTGETGTRDMAIWKLSPTGFLDRTFGNQGLQIFASSGDDQAVDVAIMGSELWIFGQVGAGDGDFSDTGYRGGIDLAFLRLDENGDPAGPNAFQLWGGGDDDEFIVHLHNYSEPGDRLALSADGGVVVAAMTRSADGPWGGEATVGNPHKRDGLVFKLKPDGTLDRNFGRGGYFRLGLEPGVQEKQQSGHDFIFSVTRHPELGYLFSGYTVGARIAMEGAPPVLTRGNGDEQGNNTCKSGEIYCYKMDGLLFALSENGAPVTSFGDRGFVFYGGTRQEKCYDVSVAPDGSIYTVGRTSSFDLDMERPVSELGQFDAAVFKWTQNGRLDPAFGENGVVLFETNGNDQALRVVPDETGAWILAYSDSHHYPFTNHHPPSNMNEAYLFRIGKNGVLEQRLALGTRASDKPTVLLPISDGLVLAGLTTFKQEEIGFTDDATARGAFLKILTGAALHPRPRYQEVARFPAPEARQGVAVDRNTIYVIGNSVLAAYDKTTFDKQAYWGCPEGDPLIHLNAGIVEKGKLWTAHSNYPEVPMLSSLEIWETPGLNHVGNHSFGLRWGSLTWVDWHEGSWYACFAHYGNRAAEPNRDPSWTQLVRLNDAFEFQEGWAFPRALQKRFDRYSSSGGGFGPDGRLYVTGHDHRELYVLQFPKMGSTLEWVDVIPFPSEGQAFAFDPDMPWRIYSILKRNREVIVGDIRLEPK